MTGKHEAPRDLTPAEHADPDGASKGWNAADVDPAELSDDAYAAQFPEVTDGAE